MRSETIEIRTGEQARVHDLTGDCERFLDGEADGLLSVFVPHATAGLAIIETGAGSDGDLLGAIDTLLPRDGRWRHEHGSAGHGTVGWKPKATAAKHASAGTGRQQ